MFCPFFVGLGFGNGIMIFFFDFLLLGRVCDVAYTLVSSLFVMFVARVALKEVCSSDVLSC